MLLREIRDAREALNVQRAGVDSRATHIHGSGGIDMNRRSLFAGARRGAAVAASRSRRSADINVGVTLSATGPAASLGIPEKNTIALLPTTIGGEKVNCIVLDDASDTTQARSRTRAS